MSGEVDMDDFSNTNTRPLDPPPLPPPIDPDNQCAVTVRRDKGAHRCPVRLSCRVHSEAQKTAVNDRSKPYDELLAQQPMALGLLETGPPRQPRAGTSRLSQIIDLDINCGVETANGTRCARILTCVLHTTAEKRAVEGRTLSYAELVRLYHAGNLQGRLDPDIHCCVGIGEGRRCHRALSKCNTHSQDQQQYVRRSKPLAELRSIQQSQSSPGIVSTGGYGLAVAGARKDHGGFIASMRRRYRRDGLQSATFEADPDGDVPEPLDVMNSPAGANLHRVRQAMYAHDTANPEQSLSKILPSSLSNVTNKDHSKLEDNGEAFLFCFVLNATFLSRSANSLQKLAADGAITNAVVIVAQHATYQLSTTSADLVMVNLQHYLGRLPLPLHDMNDELHRLFLHHSMASAGVAIPYTIVQGVRDNKPCLVAELLTFDYAGSSDRTRQVFGVRTKVAVPIHAAPNDNSVPDRALMYNFQEEDFDASADVSLLRQHKLFDIIEYIVSCLHLTKASHKQVVQNLAMIGQSFGIPILFKCGWDAAATTDGSDSDIVLFDQAAGKVLISQKLRALGPRLPDLDVPHHPMAGHLLQQCFTGRFRRTQDAWLAIADTANAADMMLRYGSDFFCNIRDMCSPGETSCELHKCMPCGSMVVCKSMDVIIMNDMDVPVCDSCRSLDSFAW